MGKGHWVTLDDFVSATNVLRYRQMLDATADETERRTIANLLAEEIAKQDQELRMRKKR